MKNKVLLCGHTGSINRGCEAIVRSTNYILRQIHISDVTTMSFDVTYDKLLKLDEEVEIIKYPEPNMAERVIYFLRRKLFKDKLWSMKCLYQHVLKHVDTNTVLFNVGGDTYCYGEPLLSYALNDLAEKKEITSIFWGCSVDESALKSEDMRKDLNKYKYIVTRESLSEAILKQVVIDKSKILKACDPAFQLESKQIALPDNFIEGNTIGINLSPLVFNDYKNENDMTRKNIRKLIEWILTETNMNISLIPHVYNVNEKIQDTDVLETIYDEFPNNKRISIVNTELSCCELKYIISKCRFFIGARTHSTIAAYSTNIPTLAISYSIKSRGIAKDLFGDSQGYAISWKYLKTENDIKDTFIKNIFSKEKEILEIYEKKMPAYKQSILDVTEQLFKLI